MSIRSLIDCEGELTHSAATKCPIVMSTRIRLARNLAQFPFPGWAKKTQKEEVLGKCLEVTVRIPELPKNRELDEREQRAVGAVARSTLDVIEAGPLPKTGTGGPRDDR